ncbi:MAG: YpdA family putative bacillithiol disulfide reductase [Planctomycetota bacterium]|jgi:thioredoxin reductase (NADPH)|nr:YpdA family putative bacillithiol disulfide reductase [Planctomycetota bacterium]
MLDVAVIGAGPVGIACAAECARRGLRSALIDRGCLCAALYRYPTYMTFFSTAERLEVAGLPFPSVNAKPTKHEALQYYRSVASAFPIDLHLYQAATAIGGTRDDFTVTTERQDLRARRVIIATGFFHRPVPLAIPGADSPAFSHYFVDGHPYAGQDLIIVGGANSAVIAALECWRMGARVRIIHRDADFYPGVKYWLLPDIRNRIAEGAISVEFNTKLTAFADHSASLQSGERRWSVPADFVLALTGYRADHSWIQSLGIALDEHHAPQVDESFESPHRPGISLAGCALCGDDTSSIFIENGREHAVVIADRLQADLRQ